MKMGDLTGATTRSSVAATIAAKSVLEKPLHQLTEHDISQLTREDCRRYLKEKGMRRPSWNKSQAIQQVISLKSLLEPPPPSSNGESNLVLRPPLFRSSTVNSNSSSSMKELSPASGDADVSVSAMGDDGGGGGGGTNQVAGTGTSSSEPTREGECRPDSRSVSFRGTDAPRVPFDQMTIFYRGGVNVYDGVPVEKAQSIMHLSVSPILLPQDEWKCANLKQWSNPPQLPTPSVKVNASSQDGAGSHSLLQGKVAELNQHCKSDGSIFSEQDAEGHNNRQVSLQRYFEKRKDRGKLKMKKKSGSSPSGLEMYLNSQMRSPVIDGQNSFNNASSKSHLGISCSSFGLLDKEQKNNGLSVDLNDEA